LREQEIDIDARPLRPVDDRHLAGQRVGATHAVDLAAVGRAKCREQDAVAVATRRGRSRSMK
jgi:hypothetical protein